MLFISLSVKEFGNSFSLQWLVLWIIAVYYIQISFI